MHFAPHILRNAHLWKSLISKFKGNERQPSVGPTLAPKQLPWPKRARMVSLQCCLLWLLLPLSSRTQKFPTRDEELFQMQIRDKAFFHDSAVIPDGAEISSYLFRDTPKRYLPTPLPLSMST